MMLVRARFKDFDFARWVDGIALALVIATPGVALALQPAVDESHVSLLAHIVDVAYPAGDILLLGATIGVIALTGWRPGRTWYLVSVGLSIWVVADALYSVQLTKGTYVAGVTITRGGGAAGPGLRRLAASRRSVGEGTLRLEGLASPRRLPGVCARYAGLGPGGHARRKRADHDDCCPYRRDRPALRQPSTAEGQCDDGSAAAP